MFIMSISIFLTSKNMSLLDTLIISFAFLKNIFIFVISRKTLWEFQISTSLIHQWVFT